MIKVSLVNWPAKNPVESISHAAKVCYEDTAPEWGKTIDIEGRLWNTGHHTTFQHFFCTFLIEDIAVGDITFGIHLANPFYNTSQRSGRFCAKMFANPDKKKLEKYVENYWSGLENREEVMDYIMLGTDIYQSSFEKAVEKAEKFIVEERPNATDKYINQNTPKIAQEQLRMFIPVIFPTALEYTVNISALAAMYAVSWSPAMKDATQKMVGLVLEKWPELDFLFGHRQEKESSVVKKCDEFLGVRKKPVVGIKNAGDPAIFNVPHRNELHPLDLLHFSPRLMGNNTQEIKTEVELSVATMGQDQRHRTVRRSNPRFTGHFYLPPIPDSLGLEKEAKQMFIRWASLGSKIPSSLHTVLAPYGAMVGYEKSASYNAAVHELSKRLCFCAQEEIYHLALSLRESLGENHPVTRIMAPNCVLAGRCGEGARYCGRDIGKTKENPFPERKV